MHVINNKNNKGKLLIQLTQTKAPHSINSNNVLYIRAENERTQMNEPFVLHNR